MWSESSNLTSETGRDLAGEEDFVDLGDVALSGGEDTRAEIEAAVAGYLDAGHRLVCLGGDHSVAYPILRA